MKKYFISLVLCLCSILFNNVDFVVAQDLSDIEISPHIIDEEALISDLFKYEIKIKNNSEKKFKVYALVSDLSVDQVERVVLQNSELDKDASLTRWIKFFRGVIELNPGQERTFPLEIDISPRAKIGKYYASIAFSSGSNIDQAKAGLNKNKLPEILVNIDVVENKVEKMKLNTFIPQKKMFLDLPVVFDFSISNIGNKPLASYGYIYVYNRRGEEIDQIEVNAFKDVVDSGEKYDTEIILDNINKVGKYKARLELEYGEDRKDIQDVIYFWYIPKMLLLATLGGMFLLIFIITYILFKKSYNYQTDEVEGLNTLSSNEKETVINLKDEG